jgi:hypothetical protein
MHDVVERCIYGVDVNPMAAELAKVSLWLEALQSGRPLTFLDAHIKVGNALLGTTPALLAADIPDGAFDAIEGDDKKYAAVLKKINRQQRERAGQGELFDVTSTVSNRELRAMLNKALPEPPKSLEDIHVAEQRYRDYEASPEVHAAKQRADAWCVAFVQPKVPGSPAITQGGLDSLGVEAAALIEDVRNQYRFFHWHLEFPDIFEVPEQDAGTRTGWIGGFSAMVGNPPWETVQMTEKEFFASRAPDIANAPTAAKRKRLIADLEVSDPALWAEFLAETRRAQGANALVRESGRYPFCARGKINTYSIFAEHFRAAIKPSGRMGIITPTGLATDATTAPFFADTLQSSRLASFFDFVTGPRIWSGIGHNRYRFAVTCISGGEPCAELRLAFDGRHPDDLRRPGAVFTLSPEEVLLLNPNTGTLPIFQSRTDAEITLGIYRRHPVLVRKGKTSGNPWKLSFSQGLFNMASDSARFRSSDELLAVAAAFNGWSWAKGDQSWLPLYEAKLLHYFDHRFATYAGLREGYEGTSLPSLSDKDLDNPLVEPLARYWVSKEEIDEEIGDRWSRDWLLGFRRLTRASDMRTFIAFVFPRSAVGDNTWIATCHPSSGPALQSAWSSLVSDYIIRQKLSGTTLSAYIVEQLACPRPEAFDEPPEWDRRAPLSEWTLPRVLELSYTSWRLQPYARDMRDDGAPFHWIPERRELLQAELDAAMFHVYGLNRFECGHVLDSFSVLRKYEERDHGEFRTKRLVLEIFDEMQRAAESGTPYQTRLDPPPGKGPRHSDSVGER